MNSHKAVAYRKRGAALIIVLAFVVLLTGLSVAYLSRSTSDRQVAHSSFNQSNVDQLAQTAMDNIIGDLRQEITNGSTSILDINGNTVGYIPRDTGSGAAANMLPQRSGNAAGAPNLIRRSVRSDQIPSPGIASRASAVNSQDNPSANGRSVTSTRWNGHYLVPKGNTVMEDSSPIPAFTNATPDWVFVTPTGATVITSPNSAVVGRYSYAVYDEGGLLDMNVAGYPTGTATTQSGRKGSIAYADLTALGAYPIPNGPPPAGAAYQVDKLVGWRNYATTQPNNLFPNSNFAANFQSSSVPATNFYNYVVNNTSGFLSPNATTWNNRTDQAFVQRQELIAFRKTTQFSVNALQYLSTFSREVNSPSFSPATPTDINPNFLLIRVTNGFTRFDGTTANVGEPLIKTRFPLRRLAWVTYNGPSALRTLPPQTPALTTSDPNYDMWALQWTYGIPPSYLQAGTAANIQACFGLTFAGSPSYAWTYTNPSGAGAASSIMTLAQVAAASREPDFFELLQAGILSGSLGQNTNGGVTGQNNSTDGSGLVFPDVHMNSTMQHLLTIGACIIDQAGPGSIPTRITFTGTNGHAWTAYGAKNLPYITQLYPIAGTSPNPNIPGSWATYLLFQLWNPHQNASTPPNNVRLRVDGAIGLFTGGHSQTWSGTPQIIANGSSSGQSVTLNSSFSTPTSLTPTNCNAPAAPGPAAGGAFAVLPTIPP